MIVHKFVSEYLSSNTYIIEFENSNGVVLIDCGIIESISIIEWLNKYNKVPTHVFLTHEHVDHFAGINTLNSLYDFKLVAAKDCALAIKSSKLNFSKYIEGFNGGITIKMAVEEKKDGEIIELNGFKFEIIHTPGHSKGGMCIKVNNILFSGDTIIKDIKTRINIRMGGNYHDFDNSIEKLKALCDSVCLIYPGHGDEIYSFFENMIDN